MVAELTRKCIDENSSLALNQEEYQSRYNALVQRYEKVKTKLAELISRKEAREEKADLIGAFMFGVMERDNPIAVFDDRLWLAAIDVVKAYPDGRLVFIFQNGAEITA